MTQVAHTHVSNLNQEHNAWLRGIEFYQDEIKILDNRLTEVSERNTKLEVKAQVEHYQNQFSIQKLNLQELKHDINEHLTQVNQDIEKYAQHLGKATLMEHDILRDKFITLEKIINELRHDFNRFLSKVM